MFNSKNTTKENSEVISLLKEQNNTLQELTLYIKGLHDSLKAHYILEKEYKKWYKSFLENRKGSTKEPIPQKEDTSQNVKQSKRQKGVYEFFAISSCDIDPSTIKGLNRKKYNSKLKKYIYTIRVSNFKEENNLSKDNLSYYLNNLTSAGITDIDFILVKTYPEGKSKVDALCNYLYFSKTLNLEEVVDAKSLFNQYVNNSK